MPTYIKILALISVLILSSACSTVKIPELASLPGFKESAESVGDYPNVSEAPAEPSDIRSDDQWDAAAAKIIDSRKSFNAPVDASDGFKSEAQIIREMETLEAKVKEYKLDDPVE